MRIPRAWVRVDGDATDREGKSFRLIVWGWGDDAGEAMATGRRAAWPASSTPCAAAARRAMTTSTARCPCARKSCASIPWPAPRRPCW
jgi:hypothetical protein